MKVFVLFYQLVVGLQSSVSGCGSAVQNAFDENTEINHSAVCNDKKNTKINKSRLRRELMTTSKITSSKIT
jgi:hypothetical protein